MPRFYGRAIFLFAMATAAAACARRMYREVTPPQEYQTVDHESPFLKAHMRDGRLFLLNNWSIDSVGDAVTGSGNLYDANRAVIDTGTYRLKVDSVALFETNVVRPSASVAALSVVTGLSAGVTVFCLADPKACFGSCPTFYASDGQSELLQAEGFSSSVAPSLEARDVDALYRVRPSGRTVEIRMLNEAYETHVVRMANLLVAPREPGRRVLVDSEQRFWSVAQPAAPTSCTAPHGDCLDLVNAFDGRERLSPADSTDLATREIVELTFDRPLSGRAALVIASRQTLMQTYLLYQVFAYLGSSVGEWLAAFERADPDTKEQANRLVDRLGGVEIQAREPNGPWINIDVVQETGPLAADVRLVVLPEGTDPTRVRLRMAQGAWRVDYVALTTLGQPLMPIRIEPRAVLRGDSSATDARHRLLQPDQTLVTFPGDEYTLVYDLPDVRVEYELFLESKGYYLEWMRQEWMAEEEPLKAAQLFLNPAEALKRLAPEFKRVEPKLEAAFWKSKYVGF
jgi:hypothetical protein